MKVHATGPKSNGIFLIFYLCFVEISLYESEALAGVFRRGFRAICRTGSRQYGSLRESGFILTNNQLHPAGLILYYRNGAG